MRCRNLIACLAVVFPVLLGTTHTEPARAAGYWNMPGTHAQRAGHGYGAGYHAPLILGPVRFDGWGLGNQVRLPYSPTPYYGCGNCGDCGRMVTAPSSMEGVVPTSPPAAVVPMETRTSEPVETTAAEIAEQSSEPAIAPADEPVETPVRPLFDPPVQH
jgi:hypothetical protein